jgi:hypothetical protein
MLQDICIFFGSEFYAAVSYWTIQIVTENFRQILGTSYTYQNMKTRSYQHVSRNI